MKTNFRSTFLPVPPLPFARSLRRRLRLPCLFWALSCLAGLANAATQAVAPLPDDPSCTAEDRKFMARAYELAAAASAKGNGAFGALVVKDG